MRDIGLQCRVNVNDAPKGLKAMIGTIDGLALCDGCYFDSRVPPGQKWKDCPGFATGDSNCVKRGRADGLDVVFVERIPWETR